MKQFYPFLFLTITILCITEKNEAQLTNLIGRDSVYSYYAATDAPPPSDWYMPEFEPDGWSADTFSIGFGESAVHTVISPATKSLYIRYPFYINNADAIDAVSLVADYDDGYVAYLNGKEIIRRNVPEYPVFPDFDDLANRSHETEGSRMYPVLGFYLDTMVLDTCLVTGKNLLAVHVFNDSTNGSDLYFNLRAYNVTSGSYSFYNSPYRVKRQHAIDSSDLPIIIIETDEFGIPYKNVRVRAHMGIIDNGPGNFNKPTDIYNIYNGNVSIEVRGESSSEFPKRSYRFETIDSSGDEIDVELLGMPADDDWILSGPFADKALFRNPMTFELASRFGGWQPRSRYCEIILNGEPVGLYSLMEKIQRGSNRIDIGKGGYILKYDKPGSTLQFVYPKEEDVLPEQVEYVEEYLKEYRATVFSNNFQHPEEGFRKYISDTSLVDYMIMNEFPKNCDGYVVSTYFYKDRSDRNSKIVYGPVWDNDLSYGNAIFQDGATSEGWHFHQYGYLLHITRLLQDREFVNLFQERWTMARNSFLHTDSILSYIGNAVNFLEKSVDRNYYIWPVIDESIFYPAYLSVSYDDEISKMTDFIIRRLSWMDDNIDDIYYDLVVYSGLPEETSENYFGFDVYPNPFDEEFTLTFTASRSQEITVDIFSLSGQLLFSTIEIIEQDNEQIRISGSQMMIAPGMYFMKVSNKEGLSVVKKIVKY